MQLHGNGDRRKEYAERQSSLAEGAILAGHDPCCRAQQAIEDSHSEWNAPDTHRCIVQQSDPDTA